ncbi:hypothetical protein QCA50_005022 [Cerrena zonata]|uniref:Uncharacterized protein n=1 Tax=Cerrena zonata TaxID=2478898 RepID=A0AAW0GN34_9APHY
MLFSHHPAPDDDGDPSTGDVDLSLDPVDVSNVIHMTRNIISSNDTTAQKSSTNISTEDTNRPYTSYSSDADPKNLRQPETPFLHRTISASGVVTVPLNNNPNSPRTLTTIWNMTPDAIHRMHSGISTTISMVSRPPVTYTLLPAKENPGRRRRTILDYTPEEIRRLYIGSADRPSCLGFE